ncbi:putative coumaroyl-CoA:anthocyanidin 3-O-glucoside-6''-O-coumaroyltransferase 2 [Iris pallida]|uniref:Coumaroyl-CoA:anthocyanidin 3-O-glucoside-6''-O-coumaroyltransferase 2 n=1 Tax=Iris pallida TaxID=29817 RepID=A0AAX6DL09_IRIPA|nr:putative coumaroyl-CoA:anthocyanidin 3-O-glucoside-6''-O-coumaroyltransferase 2 [Iris pallida]
MESIDLSTRQATMASSSSHDSTKVLEQSRVSPSPASITQHPASLPLTFFDILWLYTSPVERLFLYPFHQNTVVFTNPTCPTSSPRSPSPSTTSTLSQANFDDRQIGRSVRATLRRGRLGVAHRSRDRSRLP